VNETLGTGGTAVWRNDSLFRADNFVSYRILADGPIRTLFELRYDPWDAGGVRVAEVKRISLDVGQNLFRQESVFTTTGGGAAGGSIPYAIGIVKRPGMIGMESKAQPWAWLTGWGPVSPKLGGHGDLGNAVLLERSRVTDWKETGDHYLAIATAPSGRPVVHYVGAGWTDSGDFRDAKDWWSYLDRFAQRLAAPVKVTVGRSEN
jgi:pectinesterase